MSTEIRIFAIRLFAQFRSIFPFCSIYVVDLFHAPVLGDEPIAQNQNWVHNREPTDHVSHKRVSTATSGVKISLTKGKIIIKMISTSHSNWKAYQSLFSTWPKIYAMSWVTAGHLNGIDYIKIQY